MPQNAFRVFFLFAHVLRAMSPSVASPIDQVPLPPHRTVIPSEDQFAKIVPKA